MFLNVDKNAKIVIESELSANVRCLALMNVSSRSWSPFYANGCVFSRNEQQKVYFMLQSLTMVMNNYGLIQKRSPPKSSFEKKWDALLHLTESEFNFTKFFFSFIAAHLLLFF